jgi:GAF domain-containing protein
MLRQTFESLLGDLSSRFANCPADQVVSEIKPALKQLIDFLGFDRSSFVEFTGDGGFDVLSSVTVEGVEPLPSGRVPPFLRWYFAKIRSGKTIVLRSAKDLPPEATDEVEYFHRTGLVSHIGIPLGVGGNIVGAIGFASFTNARTWPDNFIVRLKLLGEVFALAYARKRVAEELMAALEEIARVKVAKPYLPSEEIICSRFGLTATEARLALGIAGGEALATIQRRAVF